MIDVCFNPYERKQGYIVASNQIEMISLQYIIPIHIKTMGKNFLPNKFFLFIENIDDNFVRE